MVYFHLSEAWVLCTIDNRLNIATIIWSLCSFRQRSGRMQVMQLRFYLISFFVLSIKCFPTDPWSWSWSWCLQELRNRRAEEPVPGDQQQPAGAAAQDPDPGRESRASSQLTNWQASPHWHHVPAIWSCWLQLIIKVIFVTPTLSSIPYFCQLWQWHACWVTQRCFYTMIIFSPRCTQSQLQVARVWQM